jgi:hypothetical protein
MNFEPVLSRQPTRQPWAHERLVRERAIALGHAIDRSTKSSYNSGTNSYLTFCYLHHRPIDPTPETLSFFTVFMSHHINPKSVDNYLSGICNNLEGYFPGVRAARNSSLVARTLAGCKHLYGRPSRRKRALTRDDLLVVHHSLVDSGSHDDLLFLTQLLSGFNALLRLGELVWPDKIAHRSFRKLSLRTSVQQHPGTYSFLLPTSKTDRIFEGNRVIIRSDTTPDPLVPFLTYLKSRDSLFPHRAELWLRENGSIPTRGWFLQRLRSYFPHDTAGQSIRAGGATDLAARGFAPDAIMLIGRWLSDDWRKYVRRHPILMQALLFSESHSSAPLS